MKKIQFITILGMMFAFPLFAHAGIGETFSFLKYYLLQGAALVIAIAALGFVLVRLLWKLHSKPIAVGVAIGGLAIMILYTVSVGLPTGMQYPVVKEAFGPKKGPGLPVSNIFAFFQHLDEFERIEDIARDPGEVPPPPTNEEPAEVEIFLETKEVLAEMAPGIVMNYWTFDKQVPGPLIRVKEGDTVTIHLTNHESSLHNHNIDLHAVTGPGGGAAVTEVAPGETKTFSFKALHPGLFVYHCAVGNIPSHMTHGMYGMILVDPKEGLPPVDKEFYIMQGEFYSTGGVGKKGLQVFDTQGMLDGIPSYVVFNGKVGGVNGKMQAEVGDVVRVYFGNGGVNLLSSFHLIGEIFDKVYHEAAIAEDTVHRDIQTTTVNAGGATIVEFDLQYPGNYVFVDHALARTDKGAWGVLEVTGEKNDEIFSGDFSPPTPAPHE